MIFLNKDFSLKIISTTIHFVLLCLNQPIFAERGVKYDRYLLNKNNKIHEKIFMTNQAMRVEAEKYLYLIDLKMAKILFADLKDDEKDKRETVEILFSKLKEQCQLLISNSKFDLDGSKLVTDSNFSNYKGQKVLNGKIIPMNKHFIAFRLLTEEHRSVIIIKNFYLKLLQQVNCIPIVINHQGLEQGNILNELFYINAAMFSMKSMGISKLPIFLFWPFLASQIELSNIATKTLEKEDLYAGLIKKMEEEKNEGLFSKSANYLKSLWERFLSIFSSKEEINKEGDVKVLPGTNQDDAGWIDTDNAWKSVNNEIDQNNKRKDVFDYSILWAQKSCNFFISKKGKHILRYEKKKQRSIIVDGEVAQRINETYRKVLELINKINRKKMANFNLHIDRYLYEKFKPLFSNRKFKKIKLKKTSLARNNKLCYLKSRLYKKYSFIKEKY